MLHVAPRQAGIFTHLHLLQPILGANNAEDILLRTLLHLPGEEEFVEDEVGLLEVEDDVQLADVAVVFVHLLDVAVHYLEGDKFVVGLGRWRR